MLDLKFRATRAAVFGACLVTATLSFAQQARAQGVSAGSILIGQSVPLSGSNKELGEDIRNGALAYFKKLNDAGGVHGRKIELVTLDDANTVAKAGENTRKLIEENGVFALFGYASATLSRPALPLVAQHKVPFLAPFTGADPMRVFNRHVYNMRASYADELERIVDHYTLFGIKRFSIVYYDDAVGKENLAAAERALKKRNLASVSFAAFKDRVKPDVSGGVSDVIKGNPEVIIFTTLYKATADFIKLARNSGSNAQMVSNSFPGASPLARELGKDGAGVAVAQVVPPPGRQSAPVVTEFRAAMEKFNGQKFNDQKFNDQKFNDQKFNDNKDPSFTALESYIAAKVTVEAIRKAGPKLTRESFLAALDALSHYDTGGYVIGFSPDNHNGSSYVELTIIGKDGRYKF